MDAVESTIQQRPQEAAPASNICSWPTSTWVPNKFNTGIQSGEYNQQIRGEAMKTRSLSTLLMTLLFLLGSACQFTDQALEEEQFTTQQTPDRPFRPLQATLSAPQASQPSDSLKGMGEDAPSSVRPTLTGDLDTAILSTTNALLSAINVRRALEGWPPLVRRVALTEIAKNRAIDMVVHTYLSHEDPETAEVLVENMLIDSGYHGRVAELVYAANEPLDRLGEIAIEEWFDDPDTRSVLLNPGFHFIGIGMMGDGTTWKIVQVLVEHAP